MCDFDCVYCVWNGEKLCCSASDMKEVGENVVKEYNLLCGGVGKRYSENWYYGYRVKPEWCPFVNFESKIEDNNRNESIDRIETSSETKNPSVFDCYSLLDEDTYKKLNKYAFPTCFGGEEYSRFLAEKMEGIINLYVHKNCKNVELIDKISHYLINFVDTPYYRSLNDFIFFINDDYTIDAVPSQDGYRGLGGNLWVIVKDRKLPSYIKFGVVLCNFKISSIKYNKEDPQTPIKYEKIISLEGCPSMVFGDFICSKEDIVDLNGSPKIVVGSYNVSDNKIKSLDGCAEVIGGCFCVRNNELVSLEFSPEMVGDEIEMKYYNETSTITSISDFFVGEGLDCSRNKLTTMEHCPKVVKGGINCSNNELVELTGISSEINGTLNCKHNKLKKISGPLRVLGGSDGFCNGLDASYNEIETIEDMPIIEFGDIKLADNNLSNLKGIQEIVRGNLNCRKNLIDTLDFSPKIIYGDFILKNNMYITQEDINNCDLNLYGNLL